MLLALATFFYFSCVVYRSEEGNVVCTMQYIEHHVCADAIAAFKSKMRCAAASLELKGHKSLFIPVARPATARYLDRGLPPITPGGSIWTKNNNDTREGLRQLVVTFTLSAHSLV
jgi:hypothetical protein